MTQLLIWLNTIVSFVSGAAGVVATIAPATLSKSSQVTRGEIYYQRLYSARAISLELFAGILPFYSRGPIVAGVIATTAVIQGIDVMIGLAHNDMGMACSAFFATVVHIACYFAVF